MRRLSSRQAGPTKEELDMNRLEKGSRAPSFSLKDQDGNMVKLSSLKGSKILIYF